MNKKLVLTTIILTSIAFITNCNGGNSETSGVDTKAPCDKGERVIKFSILTAATGNPKGEAASAITKRINAEMNGKACMQLFPHGSLVDDEQLGISRKTLYDKINKHQLDANKIKSDDI